MVVFYVGLFVVLMIIFGVFFVIFVNRMLGWGVDVSFFFVVGVMIVVSFISLIFLVIELMGIFILVGVGILFGVIFIYFIDWFIFYEYFVKGYEGLREFKECFRVVWFIVLVVIIYNFFEGMVVGILFVYDFERGFIMVIVIGI